MKTKDMALTALFTALIAIGAFVKIPLPTVPLTLQWFFVMMAGIVLGGKLGALSSGLYVLLGLIGIPIFAGGGGFWYVVKPTFGYFIGFIVAAFVIGVLAEKGWNLFAACAVGTVILYIIGFVYGVVIINFYQEDDPTPLSKLMMSYLVLPLPGDIIKLVLAAVVGKRVRKLVNKAG